MKKLSGVSALFLIGGGIAALTWSVALELRDRQAIALANIERLRIERNELEERWLALAATPTPVETKLPILSAQDELEAELGIQSALLELASANGITPLSFGGGPVPVDVNHDAVGFIFEFEAGHDRAVSFFETLEEEFPPLAVHELWIRQLPLGALGDVATPLSVRLSLWTFWGARTAQGAAE